MFRYARYGTVTADIVEAEIEGKELIACMTCIGYGLSPWMCECAGSTLWQILFHRYCSGRDDSWHVPPARRDYADAVEDWIAE